MNPVNIETTDENLSDGLSIAVLMAKTPDDRVRAIALMRENFTHGHGDFLAAFLFDSPNFMSTLKSVNKYRLPPKMRAAGYSEEEITAAFLPVLGRGAQ